MKLYEKKEEGGGFMEFNLPLKNIRAYLESQGWKIEQFNDNLDRVLLTKEDDTLEMVIPKREGKRDYIQRVRTLIQSLSSIEERKEEKIFTDIYNIGYDLLKVRFDAQRTNNEVDV